MAAGEIDLICANHDAFAGASGGEAELPDTARSLSRRGCHRHYVSHVQRRIRFLTNGQGLLSLAGVNSKTSNPLSSTSSPPAPTTTTRRSSKTHAPLCSQPPSQKPPKSIALTRTITTKNGQAPAGVPLFLVSDPAAYASTRAWMIVLAFTSAPQRVRPKAGTWSTEQ